MKLTYSSGVVLGLLALGPLAAADERPPQDAMPLAELVAGLEKGGYQPIVEISFDDGVWEAEAYKSDMPVEMNVDPKTGKVLSEHRDDGDEKPPADAMPLSDVIVAVEKAGYANINDISFEARTWELEATRDNQKRELQVDPKSGKVTSDRRDD